MSQFMDKLKGFADQREQLTKRLRDEGKSVLHGAFKEFFEKFPQITAVEWKQYAPNFNDGEPCTFSVHDFSFRVGGTPLTTASAGELPSYLGDDGDEEGDVEYQAGDKVVLLDEDGESIDGVLTVKSKCQVKEEYEVSSWYTVCEKRWREVDAYILTNERGDDSVHKPEFMERFDAPPKPRWTSAVGIAQEGWPRVVKYPDLVEASEAAALLEKLCDDEELMKLCFGEDARVVAIPSEFVICDFSHD